MTNEGFFFLVNKDTRCQLKKKKRTKYHFGFYILHFISCQFDPYKLTILKMVFFQKKGNHEKNYKVIASLHEPKNDGT